MTAHKNDARRIQAAIERVRDQKSFIQELLIDALEWPLNETAESIERVAYQWTQDELRLEGLSEKVAEGTVHWIVLPNNPWGIFIVEFNRPDALVSGRGMTGVLRRILSRFILKSRAGANDPYRAAFRRENLLFICSHRYERFRFAHFKAPREGSATAPMASFGWGPEDLQAVRTICEFNLRSLIWPHPRPQSDDEWTAAWGSAFDVEKVTRQFYKDYAAVFEKTEALIAGQKRLEGDDLRLFTQSLFNRLMFLRFIERKNWLTFPAQAGSRYLAALAAAGGIGKRTLYQSRIRPLFFGGLAEEGKQESAAYGKVPLLNGGLFEESDLDRKVADLPDEVFTPIISADGLFYRYNFTVEESTPLDIEVAVDPEMLGKVFEELVTGRHESGSYYTPRPVVSFMCREALKGHLQDRTDAPKDAIARLVDDHAVEGLTEAHAAQIIAALDALKAIDPACGSGAYLLGLLQELIAIRRALQSEKLAADPQFLYKLKLHIISSNLYGVDIDPFATEIAKLRLWLSLAVEAKRPVPLPNLDFKIETGDSLLGPCEPIADTLQAESLREQAKDLVGHKDDFLRSRGRRKEELKGLIRRIEDGLAYVTRHLRGEGVIDWYIHFAEVFARNGGFDIVLANPPYVRQELIKHIKPTLKKVYGDKYVGTADLYVFFYLRALQLLAAGGMLVFISSNKWFRAGYGEKLRKHLARTATVHTILDFHDLPVFESAIAYPMIFIAAKREPPADHVATLVEPPDLKPPYPDVKKVVTKYGHKMPTTALGRDGTWHLVARDASDNFAELEGTPLVRIVGKVFYRGVMSGLNKAFVVDEETRSQLIADSSRAKDHIKPLVSGRDIKKWVVRPAPRYLLFIPWTFELSSIPSIERHLRRFESELKNRPDVRHKRHEWWCLSRYSAGFEGQFEKPKIMFPDIAPVMRFAYDMTGKYGTNTTYSISADDPYLVAVLNSTPVAKWYERRCARIRGGYLRFYTQYVEQIPIPAASAADRSAIGALAQKCLDAKGVDCEEWEKEIDERVAALYGL